MEIPLQPSSEQCAITGAAFVAGDRVVSSLIRGEDGGFFRVDCLESAEGGLPTVGEVLCRWTRVFKPRVRGSNPEREMKLTAETLFLALAEDGSASAENAQLRQFLALMLERKRVLRRRGHSPDGAVRYEHLRSKLLVEVPAVEMDATFFASVRDKLGPLLGEAAPGVHPPAADPGGDAAAPATGA